MLPKVVFDKLTFVKLKLVITLNKTLRKQIQSNQKSIGKSICTNWGIENLRRNLDREPERQLG
jgi:hypothetical protein